MLNGLGHLPSVMLIDSREYVDINQYLIFKHTWCLLSNKERIASPISLWQIEIPKCLDYIACFSLFSYLCKNQTKSKSNIHHHITTFFLIDFKIIVSYSSYLTSLGRFGNLFITMIYLCTCERIKQHSHQSAC
jgi:hypothetical protein